MAQRADSEFSNLDTIAKTKASSALASNVREIKKISNMVYESKAKIEN